MNQNLIKRHEKFFGKEICKKNIELQKTISNDTYIRINLSKTTIKEIKDFLKNNRVKYSETYLPNCLKIEKSFFNISSSLPALTGKIYIQDIASQIPVNCIDYQELKSLNKTVKILDMCASPGSKTSQLADMLNYNKIPYEITALEPETKRITKLINNLQKQELNNIKIINTMGQSFRNNSKFDLILLDAPCSGNLIGDKDWLNKRNEEGILKMSKIQKELLSNANKLLDKKGVLIYSTCSMEIEENENNIKWAQETIGLKSQLPKLKIPFDTKPLVKKQNSQRFTPAISGTQGFFVCCLKK